LILSLFIFHGISPLTTLNSTSSLNPIYSTDIYIETIISLISFIYIIFTIAPGILLFIDLDSISSFNFLIYILGYQWAWTFNIYFNSFKFISFDSIILNSSNISLDFHINYINFCSIFNSIHYFLLNLSPNTTLWSVSSVLSSFILSLKSFYLCILSSTLILSLFNSIFPFIFSLDVIHSFGYHNLGFKSDAIPGRLNIISNITLFINGTFISFCYELCGINHSSMLSPISILNQDDNNIYNYFILFYYCIFIIFII